MSPRVKSALVFLPVIAFGVWVFAFAPREDFPHLAGWVAIGVGTWALVCHRWLAQDTVRHQHLAGIGVRWHQLIWAAAGVFFVVWGVLLLAGVIKIGS
jgi:hypothetical protein